MEKWHPVLKEELMSLKSQVGFQPYRGPSWVSNIPADDGVGFKSTDSGEWNVFYMYLHNMSFDKNLEKVPKTKELLNSNTPRQYYHAFYSAANPNTHIMKHSGPTNKKLRIHLPICGVEKSRMRVGETIINQEEGKAYAFDDSFEHEAWHDGPNTRILLIFDIWHPDLTDSEVKFFTLLQKAKMKYEKYISEHDKEHNNFYSIIDGSRDLIKNNDWWN